MSDADVQEPHVDPSGRRMFRDMLDVKLLLGLIALLLAVNAYFTWQMFKLLDEMVNG